MQCELTGGKPATLRVQFRSHRLNMGTNLLISDETFKRVHHCGGLDSFLIQTPKHSLTKKAWRLRSAILGYV
jgi:hypothetical protein